MRVSVTERQDVLDLDLRSSAELAPSLALPWLMKLRYGILGGLLALILTASFVSHIELPLGWLALPLTVMLLSNVLLGRLIAGIGARQALGWTLGIDVACLTAVLALSGGPANPLTLLYLVQITFSALVLSRAWTWSIGTLSVLGFALLFPLHVSLPVLEGHHHMVMNEGFSIHLVGMWIAFIAAALLITIFISQVSQTLRSHEEEVLRLQGLVNRHERIASVVTLAAGAAHELGTPLATIAIIARDLESYAAQQSRDQVVAADAKLIRDEVDRCSSILRGMRAQGAECIGETPIPVRLSELFSYLKRSFPEPQRDSIETVANDNIEAILPVETTRQALTALVKNAIDASAEGQPVELSGDYVNGKLSFTIRDSGTGMTSNTLNRIAEPFFTTKAPGQGIGLGTFLVRVFAENMKGNLTFESVEGEGTTVSLEVPLVKTDES
jgi:two-component system sensor histidine kinase RegB